MHKDKKIILMKNLYESLIGQNYPTKRKRYETTIPTRGGVKIVTIVTISLHFVEQS